MNQNGEVETSSAYCTMRRRPDPVAAIEENEVNRSGENLIDEERRESEAKEKPEGKRRLAFAGFLALVLVSVGTFAYLKFGRTTRIDYQVRETAKTKPSALFGKDASAAEEPTDRQTKAAIAQAKDSLRGGDPENTKGAPPPAIEPAPANLPRLRLPGEYVEPSAEKSAGGGGNIEPTRVQERTTGQPKHGAFSLYADDQVENSRAAAGVTSASLSPARPNPSMVMRRPAKPVTLPAFGTMLPVRTLGGIFTLRNSLARLELTRDVEGEGWELKKGTVMIAQQQGGEYDRAYLSVSGFIDPSTNRFVRVSGDLLGSDGAPGLKGKRRQVGSPWARAFNRFLQIAPGLGQAALARNGGTTVVVPTGAASDFLGAGSYDLGRREFIEVEAGSAGYVMVMGLPDQQKSKDADPSDFLADGTREGELSDEEMAHLLSDGTPEEIKAAMPRMRPEMRQIAQMVIGKSEK